LIGPNDAGKTNILEAIYSLCRSVDFPLLSAFPGRWEGTELVWQQQVKLPVLFHVDLEAGETALFYELICEFFPRGRTVETTKEKWPDLPEHEQASRRSETLLYIYGTGIHAAYPLSRLIHNALSGIQTFRWVPEHLALPVAQGNQPPFHIEPSGFGLVRCIEDILGEDRELFARLESRFVEFFPEIKSIKLRRETAYQSRTDEWGQMMLDTQPGKGLYFELAASGAEIPASQASDGILLVLAYLTLLHLPRPPRVLLIEEPENAIYPRRLKEVLEILRRLVAEQTHTQVVLTTHSPYVLDLFKPEELTLCSKNSEGAVTTFRLSNSKTVQEQIDVFTLGEIWTGENEVKLTQPIESSEATPH
jgi:hypothetical protein